MGKSSLFRPCIERMKGYVPGAQPRGREYAKLNANENPYPPSPKVIAALQAAACDSLRLYPDSMATELREKIAQRHGLSPSRVLVGNGSDDLLTMIIRSFVGEGQTVAAPRPTYPLYDVLVEMQNGAMRWVDFPGDFSLPGGLAEPGARVTFVANPNSPSGTWVEPAAIAELAGKLESVLVVDEAYADFADGDCTGLLDRFPNLIILRSFSKSFSLAGVRIGYALAAEELIGGLVKVKDSYNVNRFAIAAGVAALDDIEYMRANVARIRAERARLSDALRRLGLFVYPSHANFVAARVSSLGMSDRELPTEGPDRKSPIPRRKSSQARPISAEEIRKGLQSRGILIRTFGDPLLRDWIRISLGTPEESSWVVAEIARVLGGQRS